MAQLSIKNCSGLELLDLLFEQNDGSSHPEGPEGGDSNPAWLFPDQSLCREGDAADHFLDSLLRVCECESGSSSPLWASSPCDSGISEDPPFEHLDSPPPTHLLFDTFFFSQNQQPLPPHPLQPQQQQAGLSPSLAETDVSINVDAWESHMPPYRPMVSQATPPLAASDATSVYQLSVKDLLLANLAEPTKLPSQNSLQELVLNDDEKKLLAKEGVSLPSQLPLTKNEEKILKKVRRKIRNKQSAQESRKKKKEYLDGLEGRMAACNAQNVELKKKVIQLEKTNISLVEQLRRLQAIFIKGTNKPAQTGTCILVFVLSFSLILYPRFQPVSFSKTGDPADFSTATVQSRSLRSVVEFHSLPPVLSTDGQVQKTSPVISKVHITPEYADMDPFHHNQSEGQAGWHGDPITGHMAILGWCDSLLCQKKDRN